MNADAGTRREPAGRFLTPVDLLLEQLNQLLYHLIDPLLNRISPVLYPHYQLMSAAMKRLMEFQESGAYCVDTDIVPIQQSLNDLENRYFRDGKWFGAAASNTTIPEGKPRFEFILK